MFFFLFSGLPFRLFFLFHPIMALYFGLSNKIFGRVFHEGLFCEETPPIMAPPPHSFPAFPFLLYAALFLGMSCHLSPLLLFKGLFLLGCFSL